MTGLYVQPLGDDFAKSVVKGLLERYGTDPKALAQVTLVMNTRRAQRRIVDLFEQEAPNLLPRIIAVGDLALDPFMVVDLPEQKTDLARKLQLAALVRAYHAINPARMPERAIFELTDQLMTLLDEFDGQDVPLDSLANLEHAELAHHWQDMKALLEIAVEFNASTPLQTSPSRFRFVTQALRQEWENNPPEHPIIVAGSTGSRKETLAFMSLVLRQELGSVILPGVDLAMPAQIWEKLGADHDTLSHPQSQIAQTLKELGAPNPNRLPSWHSSDQTQNQSWLSLSSLALEPAPVTDRWLDEAPRYSDQLDATLAHIKLIEANNQREEARSIAIAVAQSVEANEHIAVISPDRSLMRLVRAALAPMRIKPDEALDTPLNLTPIGILARQVLAIAHAPDDAMTWFDLLKHALVSEADKSAISLDLQALEFEFRSASQLSWTRGLSDCKMPKALLDWLNDLMDQFIQLAADATARPEIHLSILSSLIKGPAAKDSQSDLVADLRDVQNILDELRSHSDSLHNLSLHDYGDLFASLLNQNIEQPAYDYHPLVSIWGTLEARSQTADRVILAGLNEGVWPANASNDAWLNRTNRIALGLLTPDRSISLAAHDFQQAICAKNVTLSYSKSIQGSATNPSRWVTRLSHLISGISPNGEDAWNAVKGRGHQLISMSRSDDMPRFDLPAEPRPAPKLAAGYFNQISATQIEKLIRNPYEIYASRILNLRSLADFSREPNTRYRGVAFHKVFENLNARIQSDGAIHPAQAHEIISSTLKEFIEDPHILAQWIARLTMVFDQLNHDLRGDDSPFKIVGIESRGEVNLEGLGVKLTSQADRIDLGEEGLRLIDYKSSVLPSQGAVDNFAKQMPAMALIARRGGFRDIPKQHVASMDYVSLNPKTDPHSVTYDDTEFEQDLAKLLRGYVTGEQAFVARDRMQNTRDTSDFDQLARYGEWTDSDDPTVILIDEARDG